MWWSGSLPELPDWSSLAVMAALFGAAAAFVAADRILDLLPEDEPDVVLHEVRADDESYAGTWGLSEDYWEACAVHGDLNELDGRAGTHYECYEFNPDPEWWDDDEQGGVVRANWRGQDPDSVIVGQYDGNDARKGIIRIKNELEDDAAAGRILIERYPSILRELDKERAVRFVQQVGDDVSGDIGGREVDDVLRDALPDDLVPSVLVEERDPVGETDLSAEEITTGDALAKLVDGDLLGDPSAGASEGPTPDAAGSTGAVATDGGEQ